MKAVRKFQKDKHRIAAAELQRKCEIIDALKAAGIIKIEMQEEGNTLDAVIKWHSFSYGTMSQREKFNAVNHLSNYLIMLDKESKCKPFSLQDMATGDPVATFDPVTGVRFEQQH
jgi:hypothetical protein